VTEAASPSQKFVLFYEASPDVAELAPLHFAAHSARIAEFHARGDLLLIGPWSDFDPPGAMGIFRTMESAEEFVADDPFIHGGVVASWRIRGWDESLTP
jgi:uncharacterized protein